MAFDTVFSVLMLGTFIWVLRFMLPRAIQRQDPLAITCAALTGALALLMWLMVGVSTHSAAL